jgi:hypothetical protein
MKKTVSIAAMLLAIAAFFVGCAGDMASKAPVPGGSDERSAQSSEPVSASKPANTATSVSKKTADPKNGTGQVSLDKTAESQPTPTDRKIVRNADLQLESDEPETVQQKVTTIAESKGGFVVESQQSSSDVRATRRDTVTMTVRVPAEKFSETLDEIRKSAARVIVETVKSDDVTEEFIDIEARLKAKRSLEAQFLEIMKRANTVADALNVQTEISEVRAEIEKIEGRLRFLQNQTSLSTIKIRVQTPAAFASSSKGFFYQLGDAVGKGVDVALSFVLGLVTLVIAVLPFFILVVLPIYLLIRYLVKRASKRKTTAQVVADEIGKP